MVPKAGDVVYLNPDFLKVWFNKGNGYFGEEIWEENITITEVKSLEDELEIDFKSKDFKYGLFILSNGELNSSTWCDEYKGIQVFIPVN